MHAWAYLQLFFMCRYVLSTQLMMVLTLPMPPLLRSIDPISVFSKAENAEAKRHFMIEGHQPYHGRRLRCRHHRRLSPADGRCQL